MSNGKTIVNMEESAAKEASGQEIEVDLSGPQFHRSLPFRFFTNFFYLVLVLLLLVFFKNDYQLATRACQARNQFDQSGQPLGKGQIRLNADDEKTCVFNWTTVATDLEKERTPDIFGVSILVWVELAALIFPVWKLTGLIFEMFGWTD